MRRTLSFVESSTINNYPRKSVIPNKINRRPTPITVQKRPPIRTDNAAVQRAG